MDDGRDILAGIAGLIVAVFVISGIMMLVTGIFHAIAWLIAFVLSIWYIWGSAVVLGFIIWLTRSFLNQWREALYRRRRYQTVSRQIGALFAEGENELWRIKQQYEDKQFGHRHQKYLEGR
jgi:hypothetical protein